MGRTRKNFTRPKPTRESFLFVIATEGAKTEPAYFEGLKSLLENDVASRVKIKVAKKLDVSRSSPKHVIEDLERFLKNNKNGAQDKHFLVIDIDRWQTRMLADVARKCHQKNYVLCISNPNFEAWLLLHLQKIDELSDENKKDLPQLIGGLIRGYNKSNLKFEKFREGIELAITQAEYCDVKPSERWPNTFGSRVYLAVKPIFHCF